MPYWRLSGFYFFYFAALGAFLPYWGLYLAARGFDARQIGIFMALMVGTKLVAPNLWGWIADHTQRPLPLIRSATLLAALAFGGFWLPLDTLGYAGVTLLFSFFWNASLPQYEVVTLAHLHHDSHRYSEIRLWGSVGFIASVVLIGLLLDYQPLDVLPSAIVGLLFGIWGLALLTPDAALPHHDDESVEGIAKILMRPEVLAFFAVNFLQQVAHGPYYAFFSIYLEQYAYDPLFTGTFWSLAVGSEILLFMSARRLLRLISLRNLVLASLALSALRWLLTAYLAQHALWLAFAQLLHAASFGGMHASAMLLVQHYFGLRHQGKGQALYSSVSYGLGGIGGSLYSGYCWDWLGGQTVFALAAGCSLLGLILAFAWVGKQKPRKAA